MVFEGSVSCKCFSVRTHVHEHVCTVRTICTVCTVNTECIQYVQYVLYVKWYPATIWSFVGSMSFGLFLESEKTQRIRQITTLLNRNTTILLLLGSGNVHTTSMLF